MWNLFSTVQPKVIQPAKSLKQELLQQQQIALTPIEQQLNQVITSLNSLLKLNLCESSQTQQSQLSLINQLQQTVSTLENHIQTDNLKFQDYITYRDQQKLNQQQFFKTTLRAYESKKSQLNQYIQELEDRVQALELKGLKTYELSPKPNNVLSGMNYTYLDKYLQKLEEQSKVQKRLRSFVLKNKANTIKAKSSHSSTEFTHLKENKLNEPVVLIENHSKLNSLNDLEKQLQMILLKEQVIGDMLDQRIKQCKTNFQSLAHQQNTLKQSMKKIGTICEQKKRISTKNFKSTRGFSQLHQFSNPALKKTSSFIIGKPESNQTHSQNPSIDCNESQNIETELIDDAQSPIDSSEDLNEEQVPSQNFIQACEFLITERFIGDEDQEKNQNEELCEMQIQN